MNDLSCGLRMWEEVSVVLSQSTRLTDRHWQRDRRTDGRAERPRKYRALHYMQSHGKKWNCSRRWMPAWLASLNHCAHYPCSRPVFTVDVFDGPWTRFMCTVNYHPGSSHQHYAARPQRRSWCIAPCTCLPLQPYSISAVALYQIILWSFRMSFYTFSCS